MNTFLSKLAMLAMFIFSVTAGWAALTMTFSATLYNLLLGIISVFFFFRALELVDKLNHYGPHADTKAEENQDTGEQDSLPGEEE